MEEKTTPTPDHILQTGLAFWGAKTLLSAVELELVPGQYGEHWEELMTVWDDPHSVADGILDDETYDWIGVFDAMAASDGGPIVASEPAVVAAHELARASGFNVSATGSAGLAGLMSALSDADVNGGRVSASERVAVVMSGIER